MYKRQEKGLFGEFLTNAQGEDVVAGVRTPMHISEMGEKFPEAFEEFNKVCKILEDHYRDMQDLESVSYTHLDVYKRQPISWSIPYCAVPGSSR